MLKCDFRKLDIVVLLASSCFSNYEGSLEITPNVYDWLAHDHTRRSLKPVHSPGAISSRDSLSRRQVELMVHSAVISIVSFQIIRYQPVIYAAGKRVRFLQPLLTERQSFSVPPLRSSWQV